MAYTFQKTPGGTTLDYRLNWGAEAPKGPWLAVGEEIVESTWVVPATITKTQESFTATTATIWLKEGTLDQRNELFNTIVTNQGRTEVRQVNIDIVDKLAFR